MTDPRQAWKATLGQLQMEMSKATFDTWVRDTELRDLEGNTFVIAVVNGYARDWLENRLASSARRILTGIWGTPVDVRFVIGHSQSSPQEEPPRPPPADFLPNDLPARPSANNMNPRYTFSSFVVGNSNRLAHAASLAVAENPAQAYNPLFIYGGVGLGKTHLLHAIGNLVAQKGIRVLYVTSEDFTNDLINAIRSHDTDSFRERYRRIDVLLIDDIQFIAGKESTQEEFFHTFNALHGQNRQLVLSSDRPPKAMVTLEERLRSRFEWGLTADIQPPDLEVRLAILRSKAERAGRSVPDDVLELIARRVQSNIRELEGALVRMLALADLGGIELSREMAESALADLLPKNRALDPDAIIAAVARSFGLERERLLGRERAHEVALPRQIAMYLIREETSASLPQVGEALGGRDHTTVMYGCEKIGQLLEQDDSLRRQVLAIRQTLYNQGAILPA
ncbi:MAG: chromosomal replication initiator protein DnaA [Anaerolineales bacterium]|jgi:chromosomal replication initiator protein